MRRLHLLLGLIAALVLPVEGMGGLELSQKDPGRIQRLIQQLGSDSFAEREAASRDLAAVGEPAQRALQKALAHADPEIRRRAGELLETLRFSRVAGEMAALQGLWVLKTTEYLGEKADQDPTEDVLRKYYDRRQAPAEIRELPVDLRERRTTLRILGNSFEQRQWLTRFNSGEGSAESIQGTYELQLDRSPKRLVRRWEEEGSQHRTLVMPCIYSVQGDTLRMGICLSNNPSGLPTKFATDRDREVVLLTYKRERK